MRTRKCDREETRFLEAVHVGCVKSSSRKRRVEALATILDLAFNAKTPDLQERAVRHLRQMGIKVKLTGAVRIAA